jgi:hypothetical protein
MRALPACEIVWLFLTSFGLAVGLAPTPASSEPAGVSSALGYCAEHSNATALSQDKTILCFDGRIEIEQDTAPFDGLMQGGLFVVRSGGGYAPTAIRLANLLRDRDATVVAHGYCLSACANYFLVATSRTYVTRDTIVAWHGGLPRIECNPGNMEALQRALRERRAASGPKDGDSLEAACEAIRQSALFFKQRGLDASYVQRPQTFDTRKFHDLVVKQGADPRRIFWMWNPRNHKDRLGPGLIYEAYPASQDEVDDIVARAHLGARVIYDP